MWSAPVRALTARIEGVAISSSADGGGTPAEGGGCKARPRLPAEGRRKAADVKDAPQEMTTCLGAGFQTSAM
eukprot:2593220-Pyramimonas_sp.AAC.1